MAYDSLATQRRLLDAAYREFAARGLAGARVDRIASEAGVNKQAIYAYFGSKDALFDAVLTQRLGILADRVPYTPGELSSYFVALFDYFVAEPDLVRLTQWKDLERSDAARAQMESHMDKAHQLAEVLGCSEEAAMDVFMFALAMTLAWATTPPSVRAHRPSATRRRRHRARLVAAIDAFVAAAAAAS